MQDLYLIRRFGVSYRWIFFIFYFYVPDGQSKYTQRLKLFSDATHSKTYNKLFVISYKAGKAKQIEKRSTFNRPIK